MCEHIHRKWKDQKGVSPVIGSILMVAITIVLVSVIWVIAQSILPNFSGGAPKVDLRAESSGLPFNQMRIIIEKNDKNDAPINQYSVIVIKNNSNTVLNSTKVRTNLMGSGTDGCIVYFTDDGNGNMGAGDRFLLTSLRLHSVYEFWLLYGDQAVGTTKWNT